MSGRERWVGGRRGGGRALLSTVPVWVLLFLTLSAGGSSYLSTSSTGGFSWTPASDPYPQFLHNVSGVYSTSRSLGTGTSEDNISLYSRGVVFSANPYSGGYTVANATASIYATPSYSGKVDFNGTPGGEAGFSLTAINMTGEGGSGVSVVVIGAPFAQVSSPGCGGWHSGAVYLFFGHTPMNASYNTYNADQANVTICGNQTGMDLGFSLAPIKNLTGPGASGIAIGSNNLTMTTGQRTCLSCAPHAGGVWLVRPQRAWFWHNQGGSTPPPIHEIVSITSIYTWLISVSGPGSSAYQGEQLGYSLSPIENSSHAEVAVQGYDDLLVGAPFFNATSGMAVGQVVVVSGLRLPVPSSVTMAQVQNPSPRPNSHFGAAVANVSDMGGALRQDVAVGAPGSDMVYLFAGDYLTYNESKVIQRFPGQPGSGFGWSLAGLWKTSNNGGPRLAVGAPNWASSVSRTSVSISTSSQFTSTGSSLASANPNNNVYAYSSAVAPAALNLTYAASSLYAPNITTWPATSWVGSTQCGTIGKPVNTPAAIPGTSSVEFSGTTACSGFVYTNAVLTLPSRGVVEAYAMLTQGDCLGFMGVDVNGRNVYTDAVAGMVGGQWRYQTYSGPTISSFQGFAQPLPYQYNTWYKVDILYDNTEQQYSLWINNVQEVSNVTYFNTGTSAGTLNEFYLGIAPCYQGGSAGGESSPGPTTGFINDFRSFTYSIQVQGLYTSSLTNVGAVAVNAMVNWNATVTPHSSLTVQVTANGGSTWLTVGASGGNVTFPGGDAGSSFGFRLLLRSTDDRFSPIVFGLSATIFAPSGAGTGEVLVYGSTHLNDSSIAVSSTTADFQAIGSSMSSGNVPYAPGEPSNSSQDPGGVLDNGHLELLSEEGFQDNFDTAYSTSSSSGTPAGNYTITHGSGGGTSTPSWTEESTTSVSAPNGADYSNTGTSGQVYNLFVRGSNTNPLPGAVVSMDIRIITLEANIYLLTSGGVALTYTRFYDSNSYTGNLQYSMTGTTWTNVVPFHNNVWYYFAIDYNAWTNSYDIYLNNSLGYLVARQTSLSFVTSGQPGGFFFTNPDGANEFQVDNLEFARAVDNGSWVSPTVQAPGYITGVQVFNNSTAFPGTYTAVQVSRDGGANWSGNILNQSYYWFNGGESSGNQLRYRVLLRTNGMWSPVLWDVSVRYFYARPQATITGVSAGDQFGFALSSGGDPDRDSGMDLGAGAPGAGSTGKTYLFFGTGWSYGTATTAGSASVTYLGEASGDRFGASVYLGRFNSSAPYPPSQVLMGAPLSAANQGSTGAGRVYLYGQSPPLLNLTLNYTTPTSHGSVGWAQITVTSAKMWLLTLAVPLPIVLPLGGTLNFNVSCPFVASSTFGQPSLAVWTSSAYYPVASSYYVGFYIVSP